MVVARRRVLASRPCLVVFCLVVFWILFALAGGSAVCGAFDGFGGFVSFGLAVVVWLWWILLLVCTGLV